MKKLVAGLIVLGGLAAAGILADQAVERDREYLRLIVQGDEALSRGQTFVAIEAYSEAIALKRGSMLAYLKRGEAHQRRGDSPETSPQRCATSGPPPSSTRAPRAPSKSSATSTRSCGGSRMRPRTTRPTSASTTIAAPIFYKLALASRGDGRLTRAIVGAAAGGHAEPDFHEAHYVLGPVPEGSR